MAHFYRQPTVDFFCALKTMNAIQPSSSDVISLSPQGEHQHGDGVELGMGGIPPLNISTLPSWIFTSDMETLSSIYATPPGCWCEKNCRKPPPPILGFWRYP
uniref:Uncharacterized protein n=1 Tax=Micrurus lemniscatus lemniscatus TaxID=129467 RepID=A0A2D4J3B7_MICLE